MSKTHPIWFNVSELIPLLAFTSTRGRLSLSNPELAVSALSRTLDRRCRFSNPELAVLLSLESWTGGVDSLSNAGPAVSDQFRTVVSSQVVLESLALVVVASFSRLNPASDTK